MFVLSANDRFMKVAGPTMVPSTEISRKMHEI